MKNRVKIEVDISEFNKELLELRKLQNLMNASRNNLIFSINNSLDNDALWSEFIEYFCMFEKYREYVCKNKILKKHGSNDAMCLEINYDEMVAIICDKV